MHPFAKSREYTRALTAAKIDRIFAKPFIAALSGHQDGAYCLGKDPRRVSVVAAGGGDGEVIVHSLSTRRPLLKLPQAHKGMVGGVCWTVDEGRDVRRRLITCGKLDATVKVWKSDLLAPGLKDAADDEEAWGVNEFGDAGVKTLDEDMDEAGVEDWQEAEGGGLAVDTRRRDEKAAKIEVGSNGVLNDVS
jgi:WD repeat and SOF domain-containing protein 1